MNIGINASSISRIKGGASFYIVNIIRALAAIDPQRTYIVFCTKTGKDELGNLPPNIIRVAVAPHHVAARLLWEQTVLPFWLCRKYSIGVLFSPNYTCPLVCPGFASVVTIHDLSFFPLSKLYPLKRRLFKPIIALSVMLADRIIAVSEFTKKDILKYVGNYENKISVIYEAAEDRFNHAVPVETILKIKDKFGIKKDYVLFTGFLEPRKNLERLLDAFASIALDVPHQLVIAGARGWWYNSTFEKVKSLGLADRVVFTDYVSDGELPALYAGAALFAFPSLYEGFGISVLEAICCGTPVLVSNNTALPEVAGEAGVYVDPYSVEEIAHKLRDLLSDPGKQALMKQECSGVRRKFSWERAARETLTVLLDRL
jgi:glycosyltransferase involved in cell wall biosynthesis